MIPGLYYFKNAISKELSTQVINYLDKQEWTGISSSINGRKVQQYGYKYDYISRSSYGFEKTNEIPDILKSLQTIGLELFKSVCPDELHVLLNQCIVNKYNPGQGISAHIDKSTFGPAIVCFTLGSGTSITFKKDNEMREIYVEPNSLYIMTGDSRYKWTHEIKCRLSDKNDNKKIERKTRISVTFRSVCK